MECGEFGGREIQGAQDLARKAAADVLAKALFCPGRSRRVQMQGNARIPQSAFRIPQ